MVIIFGVIGVFGGASDRLERVVEGEVSTNMITSNILRREEGTNRIVAIVCCTSLLGRKLKKNFTTFTLSLGLVYIEEHNNRVVK